jgi:hypothetical protein
MPIRGVSASTVCRVVFGKSTGAGSAGDSGERH